MKLKFLLLTLSIMGFATVQAAPLTPEEALARVRNTGPLRIAGNDNIRLCKTFTSPKNGVATVYAFSRGIDNGFMIVSADDAVTPLLGYSDSGTFDADNLPPAFLYWMEEYGNQITYMRENKDSYASSPGTMRHLPADTPKIPYLLKTTWDQGLPYYSMCPIMGGLKCYTGCIATAMAQVMNYHKYPEVGQGSISYYPPGFSQPLSIDFSETPFDWANMLNVYGFPEAAEKVNAVGYLMKACGYSVKMMYHYMASGSVTRYVPDALVDYFKYSQGVDIAVKAFYTPEEWERLIYDNLKNYGPVVYEGHGGGGHAFVCDGYDGNGYFHINWGWGGRSNGNYLLDALYPSSQGAGGSGGDYNSDQLAIIGIRPDDGYVDNNPVKIGLYGVLQINTSNNERWVISTTNTYLERTWEYFGKGYEANVDFGFSVENVDDDQDVKYYTSKTNQRLESADYKYNDTWDLYPAQLEIENNKKYKLRLVYKDLNKPGTGWQPVLTQPGNYNFFFISKDANDRYVIERPDSPEISVSSFSFSVENGRPITGTDDYDTYLVTGNSFTLDFGLNVKEGRFNQPISAAIYLPESQDSNSLRLIHTQPFPEVPILIGPAKQNYKVTIDLPNPEYGVEYRAVVINANDQTILSDYIGIVLDEEKILPPDLPSYKVSPAEGSSFDTDEVPGFTVSWGDYELQLMKPEAVSVENNGAEVDDVEILLSSTGSMRNALALNLPENVELEPGTLKITIPEGVVNVLIDGFNVANEEIILNYTLTEKEVELIYTSSLSIEDVEKQAGENPDYDYYYIEGTSFTLNYEIDVEQGRFNLPLWAGIYMPIPAGSENLVMIYAAPFEETPLINGPVVRSYQAVINFEDAMYGVEYRVAMINPDNDYERISDYVIVTFEEEPQVAPPALPDWNVVPEVGSSFETDELSYFIINWDEHNLELLQPDAVSVSNNDDVVENITLELCPVTVNGNRYNEGGLRVNMPDGYEFNEGTLSVLVPAGVVNVLIDDWKVANTELRFSFTLIEDSDISTGITGVNRDAEGYFNVSTISGVKVMVTKDVDKLRTLDSGLYIINGQKVIKR